MNKIGKNIIYTIFKNFDLREKDWSLANKKKSGLRGWFLFAILLVNLMFVNNCDRLPTQDERPALKPFRGVTFADWTADGYNTSIAAAQIGQIANAGANHLAIVITGYQNSHSSNDVYAMNLRTPRVNAISNCIDMALQQGLDVTLKFHVNLEFGGWSGLIRPDNPDEWFASYLTFITPYLAVAAEKQLKQCILATELGNTLDFPLHWEALIDSIRNRFSGDLIYAASWDEAAIVPFWEQLDYIGVNFYFPVSSRKDADRFEILKGWQPWLDRLEQLQQETGKNILLAEIGYRSIDGAGMNPPDFTTVADIDLEEQADLYWAAFEATREISWIEGMYWWNWLANGDGGSFNQDYTPHGKPAENEMHKAWKLNE